VEIRLGYVNTWLAIAMACALSFASTAQTPAATAQCATCNDRGVVPCRLCGRAPCKSTHPVLFCSEAAKCRDCGGTQLEKCAKCEHAPEVDLAKRRADITAWLVAQKPIDDYVGHPSMRCESAHFTLTFDLKSIEVKGSTSAHAAMHVYLDRLEDFFADFCKDVGCTEQDFLGKTQVMLWSNEKDQTKASSKYTLQSSRSESKLMGAKPVVSIFFDKTRLHDETELHAAMVHEVAHCLLSNIYDGVWTGNIKAGWIDEGLAHFYENRYFGEVRHYCYVDEETTKAYKFGRWENDVRNAVEQKKCPDFLSVTGLDTVAMSGEQRQFAWSYCDYIVRALPGKFGALAKAFKAKKVVSDALPTALHMNPLEFEANWKKWVLETYSNKGKK
jgi:hypothetical protein